MKNFNDKISQNILKELRKNARLSWQELGKRVHLSGQAVAERVIRMQEQGVISGFTLRENLRQRYFINIKMKSQAFDEFEKLLARESDVENVDKTAGDFCYHIVFCAETTQQLNKFIDKLLPYGICNVSMGLKRIK